MFKYYTARISVADCFADIRINDVPLLRRDIPDEDLTMEIPINQMMEKSGAQPFSMRMLPKIGSFVCAHTSRCEVEILRYDGDGLDLKAPIIVFSAKIPDDGNPIRAVEATFYADLSYTLPRWSECEEIRDKKGISESVASFFIKIGDILNKRKYDEYRSLIYNREFKICKALGLGVSEMEKRTVALFDCLDNGFELQPLTGGKKLQLYATRRVITILDHDFRPALRFANYTTGEMLGVELYLGIKKGRNSLEII